VVQDKASFCDVENSTGVTEVLRQYVYGLKRTEQKANPRLLNCFCVSNVLFFWYLLFVGRFWRQGCDLKYKSSIFVRLQIKLIYKIHLWWWYHFGSLSFSSSATQLYFLLKFRVNTWPCLLSPQHQNCYKFDDILKYVTSFVYPHTEERTALQVSTVFVSRHSMAAGHMNPTQHEHTGPV
jgi:hypothetical protein